MAALQRIAASTALRSIRRAPAVASIARRSYAEAAAPAGDKLTLSLVLPHEALYNATGVTQVNIAAATGDMGILANHVPSVEPLRPGVVEVIESSGTTKKFFVSGGFATVHPNNTLTINAVEAAPLDAFSLDSIRKNLTEAQRVANGSGSEEDKVEARIEVEVYEALSHHVTN
ncbi:putative ATP synthase delta chain precursor, mitochondrial [Clavulina sp. PMI_390]|nr:putative ATP synthase delta chain precursor, mitochondrial [Clavulina sp. PMI_390]